MHEPAVVLSFPPFRLDLRAARLELGEAVLPLRPKAYDLLAYLAARPGELLTRETLLDALWPGRVVTEGGLSELVREVRRALDDDPHAPRFIETVHGRGYRFLPSAARAVEALATTIDAHDAPVGRADELSRLEGWFGLARQGQRQLVFVTGEPGIGKTTVVQALCRHLASPADHGAPRIGLGQCIEQYGAGEAYLPLLDALSRLAREDDDGSLLKVLRHHAPTWLIQLPALLNSVELEQLERRTLGATRERMLREMAEALEVLSTARPLLLVLEDLHWSDYSTLDLITFVAQRRERARLMVLATFRPVEVYSRNHPLKAIKQDLEARGQCRDLALPCLSAEAVESYLAQRFAADVRAPSAASLAPLVHRRTDGHPLFMVNVADYVASLGFADLPDSVIGSVPNSVRQMIEKQFERLDADAQRVLEVASVAGFEFSAASLAAGLDSEDIDSAEEACVALARRAQFLQARGSRRWPDGTVAAAFGFIHALYQNVVYFRVAAGRRARLHLRIGLREERAWGNRAGDIASELAAHFEAAQDHARALDYLVLAGEKAARRCAAREALELFSHARRLLAHIEDSTQRDRLELRLSIAMGVPLIQARGYASPEVAAVYSRARELHGLVGSPDQLFFVLWGLWLYEVVRGAHDAAYQLGRQLQALESGAGANFPLAHYATGCSLFWLGEFTEAVATLDRVIARYDAGTHVQQIGLYSQDPKVVSLLYRGWAEWMLGDPDQGLATCSEAAAWADNLAHPFSQSFANDYCAVVHHLRREPVEVAARGAEAARLASEHGFPLWEAWGRMMQAKARIDAGEPAEGLDALRAGLARYEATGAEMGKTLFLALVAEACLALGRGEEGVAAVEEGFAYAERSGERAFLPDLQRLRGELLLLSTPHDDDAAQACFLEALATARRQSAKSWELRASLSLARLYLRAGHHAAVRDLLAPIVASFGGMRATHDLTEARNLLSAAR